MKDVSKDELSGSMIKIDNNLVTNHLNEPVLATVEQPEIVYWKLKPF